MCLLWTLLKNVRSLLFSPSPRCPVCIRKHSRVCLAAEESSFSDWKNLVLARSHSLTGAGILFACSVECEMKLWVIN